MKIRLYFAVSDFNAIFHLFLLRMYDVRVYMQTIQRNFQLKMHAISAAFWFFDPIQHCECSSTLGEKEEEKCVFMVTAEMLIAHEKWMIGKVNFRFKWYRDSDIHPYVRIQYT